MKYCDIRSMYPCSVLFCFLYTLTDHICLSSNNHACMHYMMYGACIVPSLQMTGPEATRIIRETYGSIHIVVGLTGNVMAEDVAFFKEHGADAVLSKPLEVSDFLVSLDEIRSQRTMSSEFPDEFRDDVY